MDTNILYFFKKLLETIITELISPQNASFISIIVVICLGIYAMCLQEVP